MKCNHQCMSVRERASVPAQVTMRARRTSGNGMCFLFKVSLDMMLCDVGDGFVFTPLRSTWADSLSYR